MFCLNIQKKTADITPQTKRNLTGWLVGRILDNAQLCSEFFPGACPGHGLLTIDHGHAALFTALAFSKRWSCFIKKKKKNN